MMNYHWTKVTKLKLKLKTKTNHLIISLLPSGKFAFQMYFPIEKTDKKTQYFKK